MGLAVHLSLDESPSPRSRVSLRNPTSRSCWVNLDSAIDFLRQFLKDEIMVLIRPPNYSMW
jgi:hypothetical protein